MVVDARGWEDVLEARQRLPEEDLILQQFVEPTILGRPAGLVPDPLCLRAGGSVLVGRPDPALRAGGHVR